MPNDDFRGEVGGGVSQIMTDDDIGGGLLI